jgi:hypothetical protein
MTEVDSPMICLAPPLPPTVIESRLSVLGISEREIRGLLSHSDFPLLSLRVHQIRFPDDCIRRMPSQPMEIKELSNVFRVTTAVLWKSSQRGPVDPQPLGPHQALDADVESEIVTLLLLSYRDGQAMTPKHLLQVV